MKEIFRNYKIPIILGGAAVVAVILTIILVTGGFSSKYGLYISSAYGTVSVTTADNTSAYTAGTKLNEGDIITVGSNSSCTFAYKGKKNSENNYIVLGADSQAVVMSKFDGKDDGELFLRSGTAIANFADEDKSPIVIRTADSSITTAKSVSKITYYTNEFMSYTDLYTFMGTSKVQLYDSIGNPVNNPEMQIEKKWGRIVSENGPSFEALNLDIDLNELSAFDLKTLITIANIVGTEFPYTPAELKAVYDTKSDDSSGISIEQQTEIVTQPVVTDPIDTSDTIQTAVPIVTTNPPPTETTLPGQTTKPRPTEATTTKATTTQSNVFHYVTIIIDGEETIQEVRHGGNAERPADPQIDGLKFVGWDGSFENITEDTVITAMFDEIFGNDTNNSNSNNNNNNSAITHTVTVVIGDKSTQLQVEHGKSANLPTTLNLEGFVFMGWDKDYTNITSDVTIKAILKKNVHTVTFIVGNDKFTVEVPHGGDALPTYIPVADNNGNPFVRWDKSLNNITMDTTITAVFNSGEFHTVTFIIDNEFYTVMVEDGGTAVPPFQPITNSYGAQFLMWDRDLTNITSDVTITAYYG